MRNYPHLVTVIPLATLLSLVAVFSRTPVAQAEPKAALIELRDGDRVVLLGGTFIERMQSYGYLETTLTCNLGNRNVTFRNLGWSGDTVWGEARAVFGSPEDGFKRLFKDLLETKPTLILVNYGANEAEAGKMGLPRFLDGLSRLLDELDKTGARIVLLSPIRREQFPPPLPNTKPYNASLRIYSDALNDVAQKRGYPFVDLYHLADNPRDAQKNLPERLTDNGIHLTQYGYWRVGPKLGHLLGLAPNRWIIDLDADGTTFDAVGTMLSSITPTDLGVRFDATDKTLPYPTPPDVSRQANYLMPQGTLKVRGLPPGRYGLRIDNQATIAADHRQWSQGVLLTQSVAYEQVEQLRRQIQEKNKLYFYRHRPQNETYLFLFRKHEQGNNAVEIPQFDPLIAEREKRIATLRIPKKHRYELRRVK